MLEVIIITALLTFLVGLFIPKKYLMKDNPKPRRKKYNDEYWTGLPWMGGKKRKKKYFWDD